MSEYTPKRFVYLLALRGFRGSSFRRVARQRGA